MRKFEVDHVYNNNPYLSLVCWYRYIDDLFVVFTGTPEELEAFKGYVNSRLPTITFKVEASREFL